MAGELGPTTICTRIGLAIEDQVGEWFGPMDVANALARGLRDGERLAGGKPVSMMIVRDSVSQARKGAPAIRLIPDPLPAVAVALNRLAGVQEVTAMIINKAIAATLARSFGVAGGVVYVEVSAEGELRVETARSVKELMLRRTGVRTAVERRAA